MDLDRGRSKSANNCRKRQQQHDVDNVSGLAVPRVAVAGSLGCRGQRRSASPVASRHATCGLRAAPGAQLRQGVERVRVRRSGGDRDRGGPDHAERGAQRQGHADQERGDHRAEDTDRPGGGRVRNGRGKRTADDLRGQEPAGRPTVPSENRVPGIPEDGHDRFLQEHVHREQRDQVSTVYV